MKSIYLFLPLLLLLLSTHSFAECTNEELEKANWLKASEYRKAKMDQLLTAMAVSKTKVDADIQKVEGGEWPLVEEKAAPKEVVADDTWEGVR